jgi:hypothetical protein
VPSAPDLSRERHQESFPPPGAHRVEPFRYPASYRRVVVIERLFPVESTKEVADPDDANDGIESLILAASISIR